MWRGAPGPLLSFLFSRLQHLSQRSFIFRKSFNFEKNIPETITSKKIWNKNFSKQRKYQREIKEATEKRTRKNFEEQRKGESFEGQIFFLKNKGI